MEDPIGFLRKMARWKRWLRPRKRARFVLLVSPGKRSQDSPAHARNCRAAQIPIRCCPNATERNGCPLSKFRAGGGSSLVKEGIGVLGMKPLGSGMILETKAVNAIECLHYAINLPTSVVITGMDKMERLQQAIQAATTFKPLSNDQVAALLKKTEQLAMTGKFEKLKTDTRFDATAAHPEWLG